MIENLVPVILAGGVGSRLWPKSRAFYPKQMHALLADHSFLQQTLLRAKGVTDTAPIVVCNEEHRFMVADQCRQIDMKPQTIVLEPEGRNSAPAIGLAAHAALQNNPHAIMMVLSSDHLISDDDAFKNAVLSACEGAQEGGLVTFGIKPSRAETSYGYLKVDAEIAGRQAVAAFVEKPDETTAQAYFESGEYLWNSGMFVLSASRYLEELGCYCPAMASAVKAGMDDASVDQDFSRPSVAFLDSPADSVDFAVMEKTEHAQVVPVSFGWNDIGAWDAILDESERDERGNHFRGDVVAIDSRDSLVLGGERLIGAIGLQDLIVVDTADALLIADKDRVQDVKQLVQTLEAQNRDEVLYHREVFRPWGSYEGIGAGDRYQVKRITVKPGASLSLQMHHHRSEHWIVVKGAGRITRGEEVFTLGENESTYIPRGVKHRLENPGKLDLELVEVQVGSYLGEDDIERFDDVYGRSPDKQG